MPSRRDILKSLAATFTAWLLPHRLFARTPDCSFHFVHADTLNSWPVADPVQWSLQSVKEPILQRAAEGLAKLTADDGDRIIRLVIRRCRLNLFEVRPGQVVVHHWSSQRADLRPFFKQHGLARPQVEVVLRERKKEVVTTQRGVDFMFGDRLADELPAGPLPEQVGKSVRPTAR